jgi:RNA recognition motif-containing protein
LVSSSRKGCRESSTNLIESHEKNSDIVNNHTLTQSTTETTATAATTTGTMTTQSSSRELIFYDFAKTLYLGDLSYFCTEQDISTIFSQYGQIDYIRIHRGKGVNSLLHGFIAFASEDSANIALEGENNREFMGRVLRIHPGSQKQSDRDPLGLSDETLVQVHVSFISKKVICFFF